jgi:hypothetical protein
MDPLMPAAPGGNFIDVSKCVTNLLFPFLSNQQGFDSGIAIANTGMDPLTPTTPAQTGTITLHGYPGDITFTTADVAPGTVYVATLSSITGFAGFQGYLVAVCQFQYAHGYAFMIGTRPNPSPLITGGYLALVIPDPTITGGFRSPSPPAHSGTGENIAH